MANWWFVLCRSSHLRSTRWPSWWQQPRVGHIIFTDGHRIRATLRVPLAVDTKTCGVTLIQIIFLVFKAMDLFSFVLFFLIFFGITLTRRWRVVLILCPLWPTVSPLVHLTDHLTDHLFLRTTRQMEASSHVEHWYPHQTLDTRH